MTYSQKIGSDRVDLADIATLDDAQTFTGVKFFEGASDIDHVYYTKVTGDAQPRSIRHADGSIEWGDGAAAEDLKMERAFTAGMRITADQMQLFDRTGHPSEGFRVRGTGLIYNLISGQFNGGANLSYAVTIGGETSWGDGTNPPDTSMARVGAGQLQTFGDFGVSGVLQAYAGTVNRVTTQTANFSPDPENDHTMLITPPLGGITATIVASPAQGSTLFFKDISGAASANPITIVSADADPIDGAPSFTIDQDYGAVELRYGANQWNVVSSHKM